jgi:hypothetical protein
MTTAELDIDLLVADLRKGLPSGRQHLWRSAFSALRS